MKTRRTSVSALVVAAAATLAASATACRPAPVSTDVSPETRAALETRAAAAADGLMTTLMGELTTTMAEGGPEGAVRVCGEVSERIAAESATRDVRVRRTSLRFRNPANAPDTFERGVLEDWARGNVSTRSEISQGADGPELRWMRPILVKPVCLPCHGAPEQIPAGVRSALKERYPNDFATGFAAGDLRGAFSVRVPVPR